MLNLAPTMPLDLRYARTPEDVKAIRFCLLMWLLGCLLAIIVATCFPAKIVPSRYPSGLSVAAKVFMAIRDRAVSGPWSLLTCAVLLREILWRRFKGRVWLAPLVLGALLGDPANLFCTPSGHECPVDF